MQSIFNSLRLGVLKNLTSGSVGIPCGIGGVVRSLSTLSPPQPMKLPSLLQPPTSSLISAVRTHIRIHFPRPSEAKRIRVHGWKKRLSTKSGRRIIMNRILKGRYILSH